MPVVYDGAGPSEKRNKNPDFYNNPSGEFFDHIHEPVDDHANVVVSRIPDREAMEHRGVLQDRTGNTEDNAMFKGVAYDGFESQPELKAKAEQLTPVLANVIRGACGEVEVLWAPQPDTSDGSLRLSLVRALPVEIVGTAQGTFTPDDLSEPWLTRSRCRDVWSDLLEDLSRLLDARIHQDLAETAEV